MNSDVLFVCLLCSYSALTSELIPARNSRLMVMGRNDNRCESSNNTTISTGRPFLAS